MKSFFENNRSYFEKQGLAQRLKKADIGALFGSQPNVMECDVCLVHSGWNFGNCKLQRLPNGATHVAGESSAGVSSSARAKGKKSGTNMQFGCSLTTSSQLWP